MQGDAPVGRAASKETKQVGEKRGSAGGAGDTSPSTGPAATGGGATATAATAAADEVTGEAADGAGSGPGHQRSKHGQARGAAGPEHKQQLLKGARAGAAGGPGGELRQQQATAGHQQQQQQQQNAGKGEARAQLPPRGLLSGTKAGEHKQQQHQGRAEGAGKPGKEEVAAGAEHRGAVELRQEGKGGVKPSHAAGLGAAGSGGAAGNSMAGQSGQGRGSSTAMAAVAAAGSGAAGVPGKQSVGLGSSTKGKPLVKQLEVADAAAKQQVDGKGGPAGERVFGFWPDFCFGGGPVEPLDGESRHLVAIAYCIFTAYSVHVQHLAV